MTPQTARAAVTIALLSFAPYLALTTTTPTDSALGTEYAAGTSYARQPIPWTAPTTATPPNAVTSATIPFLAGAVGSPTAISCGELRSGHPEAHQPVD